MSNLCQATAPYNFIPYNPEKIVGPSDSEALFTGSIECTLKSLTPLMVAEGNPNRNNGEAPKIKFNRHNGMPCIPGTSIKGMLRSLVEILSFSQMSAVSTSKIFWRSVPIKNRNSKKYLGQVYGGFLFKEGADYKIKCTEFKSLKNTVPEDTFGYIRHSTKKYIIGDTLSCVYVKTGPIKGTAYYYEFKKNTSKNIIGVPCDVIEDFLSPHQMLKGGYQDKIWNNEDIQKRLQDRNKGVPIFYTRNKSGEISAIGLCKYFRVKYDITPHDLLRHEVNIHDFANTLFGCLSKNEENNLKGKIRIDQIIINKYNPMDEIKIVLMEPHPSCLSHYLVQKKPFASTNDPTKVDSKSLSGYWHDESPELSGRKYYWHRDYCPNEIQDRDKDKGKHNEKIITTISPIDEADAIFTIHVDKVTMEELGAILMALDLPSGHAHKLGMGKPLGLGSVRIDIKTIDIQPITERYGSLLSRLEKTNDALPCKSFIQDCKDKFAKFICKKINSQDDYENLNEIKTLRRMMDFEHRPRNEATKTMTLDQFKNKQILKPALEI